MRCILHSRLLSDIGPIPSNRVHSSCNKNRTSTSANGRQLKTLLQARYLFTPLETIENAALLIEHGLIVAAGKRAEVSAPANAKIIDFGNAVLAPGLVDIHIHRSEER